MALAAGPAVRRFAGVRWLGRCHPRVGLGDRRRRRHVGERPDPLVIGGDGYDDLGIRSSGNRNIVTYDDSNVVVGGTGSAMSQIGDADTGGAVVMSIIDSHVEAGNAY